MFVGSLVGTQVDILDGRRIPVGRDGRCSGDTSFLQKRAFAAAGAAEVSRRDERLPAKFGVRATATLGKIPVGKSLLRVLFSEVSSRRVYGAFGWD